MPPRLAREHERERGDRRLRLRPAFLVLLAALGLHRLGPGLGHSIVSNARVRPVAEHNPCGAEHVWHAKALQATHGTSHANQELLRIRCGLVVGESPLLEHNILNGRVVRQRRTCRNERAKGRCAVCKHQVDWVRHAWK